jgi:hypothetical protein
LAITDQTRKLLWANAGNRCALCGRPLTHAQQGGDPAAVIGDECHIISNAVNGPRYDPFFRDDPDAYDNLLLLCSADHRLVDAQVGAYSVEKLKQLKANHELIVARAVESAFAKPPTGEPSEGFDNYRTEIVFAPGQSEGDLEKFQQLLIHDQRLRSYGRVGTGVGGPVGKRYQAWIQSFLPVAETLLHALAAEAHIAVDAVNHTRLPGVYRGLIP